MTLTRDRIGRTETWGGRLAEQQSRELATERPARLLEDWLVGDILSVLSHVPLPAIVLSRTFGARSIRAAGPLADTWELSNRRRCFLIDKKFQGGLTQAEEVELDELQAEFASYLDVVRPLPTQMLDELESLAEQLEAEDRRP